MDKYALNQYVDACALIKETEQDIERLKKKKQTVVSESVKGSMGDFPYTEKHFHIQGVLSSAYLDDCRLHAEETILKKRIENAERIKADVETWMNQVPIRMQRIIRYKFFEGMSWEQVAGKMGRNATGESVKKEFQRFCKNI